MQQTDTPFEMMLYPGNTHRVGGPGISGASVGHDHGIHGPQGEGQAGQTIEPTSPRACPGVQGQAGPRPLRAWPLDAGTSPAMTENVYGLPGRVVGATGNVGREMVNILAEREFPLDEIMVLASSRSQGDQIEYGDTGRMLKVQNLENFRPRRLGHRAVRDRQRGDRGVRAPIRQGRLHRDRQFVAVPDGPRCPADRTRGQSRRRSRATPRRRTSSPTRIVPLRKWSSR